MSVRMRFRKWTVCSGLKRYGMRFQASMIDKIYLETHRDTITVNEKTIESAKKFFEAKGIKLQEE